MTVADAVSSTGAHPAAVDGLAVEGLTVSYGRRGHHTTVLSNVSFEIGRGEAYGLVGESGCGKSTAAYTIARYLPVNGRVDGGRITLAGRDVLGLRGEQLRRWRGSELAMVYQEPASALNPTMTVGDQVAEVFKVKGEGRAEALDHAREMLAAVAMPDPGAMMGRYPHQLSGGQQQRVVVAMTLAVRPRLLVLDEPTTGLDATVEAEVMALVGDLRAELDASVLFISHNLALVARLCDRVGVLYAGRLVEEGTSRDVLRDPQHPYTCGLLRCAPRFGSRRDHHGLRPIPGSLPAIGELPPGCTFAPRCEIAGPECAVEPDIGEVAPGRRVRCLHPGEMPRRVEVGRNGHAPTSSAASPAGAPRRRQHPLLDVRDLTKRYGDVVACDGVDLEIGRGEVVGLVGESGSGKTTLGRAIVGLAPGQAGEIVFEGTALAPTIKRRSRDVQRRIQMVFQSPDSTLNPRHKVGAILRRSITRLGGTSTLAELAERVRIEPRWLDQFAARLSGGQKQRVAIARAFAGQPSLVVCDEPVSALDVSVQAAILNLLGDLRDAQDTSYLFISHDLAVVHYLADRIVVMYLGQIVEQGPASDVFRAPHHPYTEALVSSIPHLDDDRPRAPHVRIEGEVPSLADPPAGCRFHTRCTHRIEGTCEVEAPPWRELEPGHEIRCHLPRETLVTLQADVAGPRPA